MDIQKTNSDNRQKVTSDLEFNVMPKQYLASDQEPKSQGFLSSWEPGIKGKILKWGGAALLVLLILGGGYFTYTRFFADKEATSLTPPNSGIEVPPAIPEDQDTDNDGLSDSEELKQATDSKKADSDGDGLSDGDEVKIYLSDPLLKDTDADSFDDGREVARGYSPVINSSEKATAKEIQDWTDRITEFGLHEPTPITLKLKAGSQTAQSKVKYSNSIYKYSLELPAVLAFREADEGRLVGIYITGTNPEAEILSDPINVSLAVKVTSQTLKDWVNTQYQIQDYQRLQEIDVNGVKAIRLFGVKDEFCAQDKTFFARDNNILVLAWTCNENTPFAELYEQIVQSFKFQ